MLSIESLEEDGTLLSPDTYGNPEETPDAEVPPIDPCEGIICDDSNPCTLDTCSLGFCIYSAEEGGDPCDDLDFCTENDTCGEKGECLPGDLASCEDASECTDDSCDPLQGCINANKPEGTPCDDSNACSLVDSCESGVCNPGVELTCDDENPCTVLQGCDPASGKCLFLNIPEAAPCEDGNLCTNNDFCQQGFCTTGGPLECEDNNSCTQDSCNPKSGCSFFPGTFPCDDGNFCTSEDMCTEGSCIGAALNCNDGNSCTQDGCDAALGCIWNAVQLPCDDDNPCTVNDTCQNGQCVGGAGKICENGTPCITGSCQISVGGCVYVDKEEGDSCEDNNACTLFDNCSEDGVCEGEQSACDDGNPCTTDSCDFKYGCLSIALDSVPCTEEGFCGNGICSNGSCSLMGMGECDDGNLCTTDFCNELLGCIFLTNPPEYCDDGIPCTFDTCVPDDGCSHVAVHSICAAGALCSAGFCDESTGCEQQTIYDCCGNGIVEANEQCDDFNGLPGDGCSPLCTGEISTNSKDCADLLFKVPDLPTGIYTIDPDGSSGPASPTKVWCDMTRDGGGWTLIAIAADDGSDHWVFSEKSLWNSSTSLGALSNVYIDYASPLRASQPFEDVLFLHKPSDQWAAYHGVNTANTSFGQWVDAGEESHCSISDYSQAFPMSAGTIIADGVLCSTTLFLHPADQLGTATCEGNAGAYGPAWNSVLSTGSCIAGGLESPGVDSSIGMNLAAPFTESNAYGFAKSLNLNTGVPETGVNSFWILVRKGFCGDGVLGGQETCDDGNLDSGDGCSSACQSVLSESPCDESVVASFTQADGQESSVDGECNEGCFAYWSETANMNLWGSLCDGVASACPSGTFACEGSCPAITCY